VSRCQSVPWGESCGSPGHTTASTMMGDQARRPPPFVQVRFQVDTGRRVVTQELVHEPKVDWGYPSLKRILAKLTFSRPFGSVETKSGIAAVYALAVKANEGVIVGVKGTFQCFNRKEPWPGRQRADVAPMWRFVA
jgi:hypothetical protein